MRVAPISDVHIETGNQYNSFTPDETPDVYILAGDIHTGVKARKYIEQLLRKAPVIYVAGNHEFYHNKFPSLYVDLHQMCDEINAKEIFEHKVWFLENESLLFNGYEFLGATLWTNYDGGNPVTIFLAERMMLDFQVIHKADDVRVTAQDFLEKFYFSKQWLTDNLMRKSKHKKVVITHHSPSFDSVHPIYAGDKLNGAFHTELKQLIIDTQPRLWIHGHIHNVVDYKVGDTRIVANPHGYPFEDNLRALGYSKNMMVEI